MLAFFLFFNPVDVVADVTFDQFSEILKQISIEELLKSAPSFTVPLLGSLVEGTVIDVSKNKILVDIGGVMTGIISGKEAKDSSDTADTLSVGDTVYASVIELENEEGLMVLSLRRASKERTWRKFLKAFENKELITVRANEANKGGLLLEIDGIKGFIPVSQLAPLHYPRVNGADSGQILNRLTKLVGEKFDVRIINIDRENGKLILSEKAAQDEVRRKALKSIKVGQKVSGIVSGVVKFGIFVAFDGLEGLIHISEIAWGHVKDPLDYAKFGDKVEVIVIGVEGEKISLSMKRLVSDPWAEVSKNFPVGTIVEGEVNRITPFGVFIKLSEEINGLIHSSELGENIEKNIQKLFNMGHKIKAKVINIDLEERRIGLSLNLDDQGLKSQEEISETIETTEIPQKSRQKQKKKVEKIQESSQKDFSEFLKTRGIGAKIISSLQNAGYTNNEDLKALTKDKILKIHGIGEKTADKLLGIIS